MIIWEYPHKVNVNHLLLNNTSDDHWHLKSEMARWCYVNLGSQGWLHDPDSFEFEHAHDMAAFILTWSA